MPTENLKKSSLVSVLFGALFVCAVWLAIVQPWSQSAASPLTVAITSALAAGMLMAWRRTALGSGASDDVRARYGVLKDLALAFAIMTLVALAFAGLNFYLEATDSAAAREATLARVAAMQGEVAALSGWIKSFDLAARIGGAVLVFGLILIVLRAGGLFDALFKARAGIKRALRVTTLASLCIGSFSLGGGVGATVIDSHARRIYALNAGAGESRGQLQAVIEREVAEAVTDALLENDRPECRADANRCNADPLLVLHDELERARSWHASWPERPAALGLPPEPSSTREFAQAVPLDAAAEARPGARQARDMIASVLRDRPVAAAQLAVETLAEPPAAPERKRLRDLVGLALSLGLETSGLSISPNVDAALGGFVTKIAGSISGAVQSQFESLVRDAAIAIVEACKAGPSACRDAGRRRLDAILRQPRTRALVVRLAEAARAPLRRYRQIADSIGVLNAGAQTRLDRAIAQVELREGQGEWGALRRRWTSNLQAGRVDDLTPAQREGWLALVNDWQHRRGELAREMVHEGRIGSPAQWDEAFLAYTRADPNAAAIFGYMVLNDQPIRPFLIARQPATLNREINVANAYLLFAATIEHQSWAPDSLTPDRALVNGFGFRDAVGRYCPHAGGL